MKIGAFESRLLDVSSVLAAEFSVAVKYINR